MVGLEVMRGAAGVAATLKQRTWQLEHAEDWAGALEVWEFIGENGVSSRELPNNKIQFSFSFDGIKIEIHFLLLNQS